MGQYIKVDAFFTRSKDGISPILSDLTIGSKLFVNQKPTNETPILGLTDKLDVETNKEIEIPLIAQDDLIISGNSMKVTWTSTNDSKAIFNDKTIFNPKVKFIEDGTYKLTATVFDGVNTVSKEIIINATTKPVLKPALNHNLPTDMKTNDHFETSLTVTNMPNFDRYEVSVNNTIINVINSKFNFNPTKAGEYNFVLRAYDTKNSFVEQTHKIIVTDSKPPLGKPVELIVNNGNKQSEINKPISVVVTNFDEVNIADIVLKVNNTIVTLGNTGTANVTPSKPGDYTFTLTGKDKYNNILNKSITIKVVDSVPKVSNVKLVVNDGKQESETNEKINIAISNFNEVNLAEISVKVNNTAVNIDSTGKGFYIPTKAGDYTFTLIGKDKFGINLNQSIIIKVANTQGKEVKLLINNGNLEAKVDEPIEIAVTNYDLVNPNEIQLKIGTQVTNLDNTGKVFVKAQSAGNFTVTLTGKDKAGKLINESVTVTVIEKPKLGELKLSIVNGLTESEINKPIQIKIDGFENVNLADIILKANNAPLTINSSGTTIFTPNKIGLYTFTLTGKDKSNNQINLTTKIDVYDPNDQKVPDLKLKEISKITEPVKIIGTVTADGLVKYTLAYAKAESNDYTIFNESSTAVADNTLGIFDPTKLKNGYYKIKLTGHGSNKKTEEEIIVSVEGNMKIGNFSMDFNDIQLPILNFPLTVIRGYDSRDRNESGDFGYGWNLNMDGAKISESTSLHSGYVQKSTGKLPTMYYIEHTKKHEVSIDWGNGKVDKWALKISPDKQAAPMTYISINFEPVSKIKDKLEVYELDTDLIFNGNMLFNYNGTEFKPEKYKLTKQDGTIIIFNKTTGIEKITTPTGDVITISKTGVTHSDGKSIVFIRDAQNRITEIKDSNGKKVLYTYDINGDLATFTDIGGKTTRFKYNKEHYLTEIIDPRGVTATRNEYNEFGRLIATIDANGNRTEYTHDIGKRQEIIKDKLGNVTVFEYDNFGNVLTHTDALGNKITNTYDANHNLKTKTDQVGNTTTFSYTEDGKLLSATNQKGNVITNEYNQKGELITVKNKGQTKLNFTYDKYGNTTKIVDAEGNEKHYEFDQNTNALKSITDDIGTYMKYTYDSNNNVVSTENGNGDIATFTYDKNNNCTSKTIKRNTSKGIETITENYVLDEYGRVTKVLYKDGTSTSIEYNNIDEISAQVDSKGRRTKYDYDLSGNLSKITYSDNTFETFEYDAEGRNTKATDRMGRQFILSYDALGNLVSKTYPNKVKETYNYDAKYRLIKTTNTNGASTYYEYDSADKNTAITDAFGNKTEFYYNELSQLTERKDAKGNSYKYEYDKNGNQTKLILPDKTSISSNYDARSRVISQIDQNGYKITYGYDGLDRLTSVTDAKGGIWKYEYNNTNDLICVTDASNNKTTYEYDIFGRVIKTTNPAGQSTENKYDIAGNLTATKDYKGTVTTFSYDELDRVSTKTDDTITKYTYTLDGMLSSVADKNGTTIFKYNEMNNLTEKIEPDGLKITYEYDSSSRLTKITTPYGHTIYVYDIMSRITKVIDKNGLETSYTYDKNGNRETTTLSNGTKTTYVYDIANRLTEQTTTDKSGKVISKYKYTLGKAGERLKVEELNRTVVYSYDNLYRLTQEKVTEGLVTTTTIYAYDRLSNRVSKTVNGKKTTYTYNILNQLLEETDIKYKYDLNGNLIEKSEKDTKTTYTYDKSNKLIRATVQKGLQVAVEEYKYDFAGNRIYKGGELSGTRYLIDTNNWISLVVAEIDTSNNKLSAYYTRGHELISLERNNKIYFYLFDGQGSTRKLINQAGSVTDTYNYDAFGKTTQKTGVTQNEFLYNGEQYDSTTGLYYLRARYMNPSTGTFISMDPYQGSTQDPVSLHKYLYANANPVMNEDPTGYFTMSDVTSSTAIQGILNKIATLNYAKILKNIWQALKIINFALSVTNLIVSVFTGDVVDIAMALLDCIISAIELFNICNLQVVAFVLSKVLAGIGLFKHSYELADAIDKGDMSKILTSVLAIAIDVATLFASCFTGETLVHTEHGYKRIDEIEIGDFVWAYNVETGETELKEVLEVYEKETEELVYVTTDENETINTTSNHPFYVVDKGFVAAGDLNIGDVLYKFDGTETIVKKLEIEKLDEAVKVYNLNVFEFHSYFVSDDSVLVHNYENGYPDQTEPYMRKNEWYGGNPNLEELDPNRPYLNLTDSRHVGPGKDFTAKQKKDIIKENMRRNGGVVKSDKSDIELVRPSKSQKGVTPPENEWQIDHIISRDSGGSNSSGNAQVLSRKENRDKWNK